MPSSGYMAHRLPAGQSVRSDQIEALLPVGPELAKDNPKQLVEQTHSWFRLPPFQDEELLAKKEVLRHQVLTGTKKVKGSSEPDPEKVEHSVESHHTVLRMGWKLRGCVLRPIAAARPDAVRAPQGQRTDGRGWVYGRTRRERTAIDDEEIFHLMRLVPCVHY
jgi:hypothetical protein